MMPHFFQKAQQVENRWLLPILAAVSLAAAVDPTGLAEASGCQGTEADGMTQSMATEKGTMPNILSLTSTMEPDTFGGLLLFPVREGAIYVTGGRIDLGNRENQGISTSGACLSQDFLKSAFFNPAAIKSIGKAQTNARKQSMKISALPYNGKRHVHRIRTIPPEIGVSARSKTVTIIGPVQEIRGPILSNERSASQIAAVRFSTVESPFQFEGQSIVDLSPFASVSQLPDNESLRMNRTSAQALHGGNCASECP